MATDIAVLTPYRAGDTHRDRTWAWLRARWATTYGWPVITGDAPGDFNRAPAIRAASAQTAAELLVIADADVWCDDLDDALDACRAGAPWAVPHHSVHRLDEATTARIVAGGPRDPIGYDQKPYRGNAAGGLVVMPVETLRIAPPDARFAGWGQEDDAWSLALSTLVGAPWRGEAALWHLWHPHPARRTRRVGNVAGEKLLRRYRKANGNRQKMLALIVEGATDGDQAEPNGRASTASVV